MALAHRNLEPDFVLGHSRVLVLTNHYPDYDDLYRNGFVHSRVKSYRRAGLEVDVFLLRHDQPLSYREFEGVSVTSGSKVALHRLLGSARYKCVSVHFLDPDMWEVLSEHITSGYRVIVWVHGSEIQPWWRRSFNYCTKAQLEAAKCSSERRITFWRDVLRSAGRRIHLVFVSEYFAREVMEDLAIDIPTSNYSIIHNPIDTDLFEYVPKDPEQRCKILSIRSYASLKYANDLMVDAILRLKEKPFFGDLEFRLIGRGRMFDSLLQPLRGIRNVTIQEGFLTQSEIARVHRDYGVFLNPTRMDSQGVSRDEAMSSGLVPITSRVAAIPEFVDESCGFIADPEDAKGLALAIETLYSDPDRFTRMSRAAADRVRRQSGSHRIIELELQLIDDEMLASDRR
jgi:glycosyltransferase involved in cell wall biosynthesis